MNKQTELLHKTHVFISRYQTGIKCHPFITCMAFCTILSYTHSRDWWPNISQQPHYLTTKQNVCNCQWNNSNIIESLKNWVKKGLSEEKSDMFWKVDQGRHQCKTWVDIKENNPLHHEMHSLLIRSILFVPRRLHTISAANKTEFWETATGSNTRFKSCLLTATCCHLKLIQQRRSRLNAEE